VFESIHSSSLPITLLVVLAPIWLIYRAMSFLKRRREIHEERVKGA
jgi:hypothetical protein